MGRNVRSVLRFPSWQFGVLVALGVLALVTTASTLAQTTTVTLYDGSEGDGTQTPDDQALFFATNPLFGAQTTQSATGGITTLDSTANTGESAGYSNYNILGTNPNPITLDRSLGYTLTFTVQVVSETHISNDRAGFSVIALSSDLEGIELGFWQDRVWAQNDDTGGLENLFTQGEGVDFDTTSGLIRYDLAINDNTYTLSADGSPILNGNLRNYEAFSGAFDVYEFPNLIFLGDDTSSAAAEIQLSLVEITTASEQPPAEELRFTSTPTTAATVGTLYLSTVTATGGTAPLSITAPTLPAWLSLNETLPGIFILQGTPTADDVGEHEVSLLVTDDTGATAQQDFIITVEDTGGEPEELRFTSTAPTSATVDLLYNYPVVTTGGTAPLTISAATLPDWLTLSPTILGAAVLSGTPAADDVGEHPVSLVVTDDTGATAQQDFTITVEDTGGEPGELRFTSTAPTSATVATLYSYPVQATGGTGTLTITAATLPDWLTLSPTILGTAVLSGTPAADDLGEHPVSLVVTDDTGATAQQDFTITVEDTGGEPQELRFTSTAPTSATVATLYSYPVQATGGTGTLTITAATLPAWLTLSPTIAGTTILSGTPSLDDVGEHPVSLVVTDSTGATAQQDFIITVASTGSEERLTVFLPLVLRAPTAAPN